MVVGKSALPYNVQIWKFGNLKMEEKYGGSVLLVCNREAKVDGRVRENGVRFKEFVLRSIIQSEYVRIFATLKKQTNYYSL